MAAEACLLLGIEPTDGKTGTTDSVRNELAVHLARDISKLKRLAEARNVTLFNLATANLLSGLFAAKVSSLNAKALDDRRAHEIDLERRNLANRLCHSRIGELNEDDINRLNEFRYIGKQTAAWVKALQDLYRETDGFRTVQLTRDSLEDMTSEEQEALLATISAKMRADPGVRKCLRDMFPA